MKNIFKSALAFSALAITTSFGEIKVADNLAISGFVDMSATYTGTDGTSDLGFNLDQVELDFVQTFSSKLSASFDLNYVGGSDQVLLEQGYLTLSPEKGANIYLGRFLSSSGFEAAEPTGLFQYSVSKTLVYGGYQNGIAASYRTDAFSLYASVVTDAYNAGNSDLEYPGFEGQLSFTAVENLVAKATYVGQFHDRDSKELQSLVNLWAMYGVGGITFAGEFNSMMNSTQSGTLDNGIGWIGLVNISNGTLGATVRYSGIKWDEADKADTEITFAPSIVLNDGLSLIAEYKYEIDAEINNAALEALFVF